jgi:hypothetical protein
LLLCGGWAAWLDWTGLDHVVGLVFNGLFMVWRFDAHEGLGKWVISGDGVMWLELAILDSSSRKEVAAMTENIFMWYGWAGLVLLGESS